nr:hypothetical protein [Methylomarinum sp. Ch1-1]MDP4520491.1 hypothetical protein [Methylomarinum sp. Ch1-1]
MTCISHSVIAFRAEGGAPTQSTVLPSDVSNTVKRIKNRCASYHQHTHIREMDHAQRIPLAYLLLNSVLPLIHLMR